MQETVILELPKLIITFCILLLIANCGELSEYDNQRIKEALGDSLITSSTSLNINMDIMEDGLLILNLKSSKAHTITEQSDKTTYLSGPVEISIFKADSLDTEVLADSAVYIPKDAIFQLYGNVKVLSKNGKSLFSDYLRWQREKDEVDTPGNVIIITEADSIVAVGFVGDTDLTNYTLNQVTGKTQFN